MSRATHILASAGVCAAALTAVCGTAAAGAASCSTIGCVEHQVTALTKEVKQQASELTTDNKALKTDDEEVSALNTCLAEVPMTRYGDSGGTFGYAFSPAAGVAELDTTGLDVTRIGTKVQAWALFDGCNTSTTLPTTASVSRAARADRAPVASSVFAPIARDASLAIFFSERP